MSQEHLDNETAYIPPQCYTKTIDSRGDVHNPCYTCHAQPQRPNFTNDADLQLGYDFPDYALINRWSNLFKDRSEQRSKVGDETILAYIRRDNYKQGEQTLLLRQRLEQEAAQWDRDGNGIWNGYTPDAFFKFDPDGFDYAPDGEPSGWRAFQYYPFPGTFWPANGSFGDALIRLPDAFRQNQQGDYDPAIYKVNLAIVESLMREQDISIHPVDERLLNSDLNNDGKLGIAEHIAYTWNPRAGIAMHFVGKAALKQQQGRLHAAAGLYPEGTEFLHSVRYLDIGDNGRVMMAARMKELRYARKDLWLSYSDLIESSGEEIKEKHDFPDRLKTIFGDAEHGISNGSGWIYQGFIEDTEGKLRPQSFEESAFCIGCHGGLGTTSDSSFAFPRKLPFSTPSHGWGHASAYDFSGAPEPIRKDGRYAYSTYLEQNGGGDEFRQNQELIQRFFNENGQLHAEAVARLHRDVGFVLYPTPERALELNKAYWLIVREQSYKLGRDALIEPAREVHREVEYQQSTGIEQEFTNPGLLLPPRNQ